MGSKQMMMKKKEDRISCLPNAIIQHILSFLPSTKEAIQTSVLSKRWQKQWTQLPVLIFDLSGMPYQFSDEDISRICRSIDSTLIFHDCPKLKKFHIQSRWYNFTFDPNYLAKLHFPIRKEADELILELGWAENNKLPNFFFENASLIKLKMINCILSPSGMVNWKLLKDLYIKDCSFPNQAIFEGVVSGCPLLESLEIHDCEGFDEQLAIASKSLKKLVLVDPTESFDLEVSCPNLVEFYALIRDLSECFSLSDGAIRSVLSGSPLLELLELNKCDSDTQLVIDSNSLKKLILVDTEVTDAVVISCPNLEELQLHSLYFETIKLINIPSLLRATIDCNCETGMLCGENSGRMILEQLHHLQELNIGRCFIKVLSALEMRSGLSFPSINSKCLTLDGGPNFVENLPGIAYALRTSPELEELVLTLRRIGCATPDDDDDFPDLNICGENYWNSKGTAFNCLASHLKIVKIFGFSEKDDDKLNNLALDFVEFLLKNTRVLEKMVIILEDRGADFVFKVSQKLLSFSRFSQHAVIELLCSKSPRTSIYSWHA